MLSSQGTLAIISAVSIVSIVSPWINLFPCAMSVTVTITVTA